MRKLILVRHGPPEKMEAVPAREWHLSTKGRLACEDFFKHVVTGSGAKIAMRPGIIVSSHEPKAIETAEILAKHFDQAVQVVASLHEHDRSNMGYLEAHEFNQKVAAFFAQPNHVVMGLETANQALQRFSDAIAKAIQLNSSNTDDVVIVTHGTVMSLYLAPLMNRDPFLFWQKLGMPALFSRPLPK